MSQIDEALRRLDGALGRLEAAIQNGAGQNGAGQNGAGTGAAPDHSDAGDLKAERDRLAAEVHRLRSRAADDARLRAEAADAVREALHDLRGAIGQPAEGMHGNA